MSDLAAAAAALGVPESLVKRSAEARAKASGTSVDQVLAAWAGGVAAPEATATAPSVNVPPPAAATAMASAQSLASPEGSSPLPAPAATLVPEVLAPASTRRAPTGTPVLIGARQGVGVLMSGSIGLLLLSLLLGFVVPGLPQPGNGVRSSNHAFSQQALIGRGIYLDQGCGSCHTQLIRDVVSDASLGPVTLADTNLVVGSRRLGPDLAAIGDRIEDRSALTILLTVGGKHPKAAGLDDQHLSYLLSYLMESR